jgi:hypothetical protein
VIKSATIAAPYKATPLAGAFLDSEHGPINTHWTCMLATRTHKMVRLGVMAFVPQKEPRLGVMVFVLVP